MSVAGTQNLIETWVLSLTLLTDIDTEIRDVNYPKVYQLKDAKSVLTLSPSQSALGYSVPCETPQASQYCKGVQGTGTGALSALRTSRCIENESTIFSPLMYVVHLNLY